MFSAVVWIVVCHGLNETFNIPPDTRSLPAIHYPGWRWLHELYDHFWHPSIDSYPPLSPLPPNVFKYFFSLFSLSLVLIILFYVILANDFDLVQHRNKTCFQNFHLNIQDWYRQTPNTLQYSHCRDYNPTPSTAFTTITHNKPVHTHKLQSFG